MNKINELEKLGFKINWKLIDIGYRGDDFLSKQDIIEYTYFIIETDESMSSKALELLSYGNDMYMFDITLSQLSRNSNADIESQKRKWIVLIIIKAIENFDSDYTEGLLELNDVLGITRLA